MPFATGLFADDSGKARTQATLPGFERMASLAFAKYEFARGNVAADGRNRGRRCGHTLAAGLRRRSGSHAVMRNNRCFGGRLRRFSPGLMREVNLVLRVDLAHLPPLAGWPTRRYD